MGSGRTGWSSRLTRANYLAFRGGQRARGRRAGAGGAETYQGGHELARRPASQRAVVGEHLDQQRHRTVGAGAGGGPGERAPQGGERQQHEVMALAQVGSLVREDGRQLAAAEQLQGADADHDLRPQSGQAVCGRARIVDDERARHLRVTVGEQREQGPLSPPGVQRSGRGGDEHPAQRREQDQPGRQAGQPDGDDDRRQAALRAEHAGQPEELARTEQSAGPQHGAHHADGAGRHGQADQRADGGQAGGQAQGLPQQDGRSRRPPRPASLNQCRSAERASGGNYGEKRRVLKSRHLPRRCLRSLPGRRAIPQPRRQIRTVRTGSMPPSDHRSDPARPA